jgi:hypothetical protein
MPFGNPMLGVLSDNNVSRRRFLSHSHAFLMIPDDESYPGFRCRHNISYTIHALTDLAFLVHIVLIL